ncbi:uncharacterized protein [Onthophagus taurus]|uniref:uncharacterized protein n=1 Tax=Onthophagus taurus TaxID=166361 RepID=UPI000C206285|nr:uncharacterized protein LOC111417178 [Onthophagus taurus]
MTVQVQKEPSKFLVSFCCFKPSKPHAIVCAILWTIFLSLSLIACIMMFIEVKFRAELLNEDYVEELGKRKHLHNGSVIFAPNEAKLCENMEKTIFLVSSIYQMCETSTINFLGAIFSLYSILKSKPLFSVPFFFSSFLTGISATFLFAINGYWKELMLLPKEKLLYVSCISSIFGILMLSIWIPLAVYNLDQLKKLVRDAERMNPLSFRAFGGMTHTIKPKMLPKKFIESNQKVEN